MSITSVIALLVCSGRALAILHPPAPTLQKNGAAATGASIPYPGLNQPNLTNAKVLRYQQGVEQQQEAGRDRNQIVSTCIPELMPSLGVSLASMFCCMAFVMLGVWILALKVRIWEAEFSQVEEHSAGGARLRRPNIDALDGLRAALIAFIMLFHLRDSIPEILRPYFTHGHWTVQFFFVLSGFVAFYVAESELKVFSLVTGTKFIFRRLVRLLPAYYFALAWMAFLAYNDRYCKLPFLGWPSSALLLQTLIPVTVCGEFDPSWWNRNNLGFASNGPGWFVSAIAFASCCFPALFNLIPRSSDRRQLAELDEEERNDRRYLAPMFLLILVVACRSSVTVVEILRGHIPLNRELGLYDWNTGRFNMYSFALPRLAEFFAGMCACSLCSHLPSSVWYWNQWAWAFDAIMASVPLIVYRVESQYPYGPPYKDYFLTGVFCLICIAAYGVVANRQEQACQASAGGVLHYVLSLPAFVWIAQYSYGAYIFQEPVNSTVFILLHGRIPDSHLWLYRFCGTWLVGGVSLKLLELPVRRAFEGQMRSHK